MKAPRIPSFFKHARNQPRRFNYQPRLYDEQRERIEKRKKEIEAELRHQEKISRDPDANHRESEHNNYLRFQRQRQTKQSNLRLIIIMIALLLGTYLMLQRLDILSQSEGTIF